MIIINFFFFIQFRAVETVITGPGMAIAALFPPIFLAADKWLINSRLINHLSFSIFIRQRYNFFSRVRFFLAHQ